MVSSSLQRLWVPGRLNAKLQTILISPCAKELDQDFYDIGEYIHRISDLLEDLEQKLEGLLPKHFSTKIVLLHKAMQYSVDDYYSSEYEDEENDWGDEDGNCG